MNDVRSPSEMTVRPRPRHRPVPQSGSRFRATLSLLCLLGAFGLVSSALWAQPQPPGALRPGAPRPAPEPQSAPPPVMFDDFDSEEPSLKFENAPIEIVLEAYAQATGRTLLRSPGLPSANISLRSRQPLSPEDYLLAIETVLSMHGVSLLPVGEQFVKVVPLKDARRLGIRTELREPDDPHVETGQLVSQMVELKHVAIGEIRAAMDGLRRSDGQIQAFERTNSILITDTADNVNRMIEIIRFIDQPIVQREEANVRQIRYAKASEIKSRLEEVIADARREQQQAVEVPAARRAGAPGIETRTAEPPPTPGVIRPRRGPRATEEDTPEFSDIIESLVSEAERGVIRGRVHIVADDRTNVLIIITRPENMTFFDRIISVLDVETAPDVVVEVLRLEHAVADEVAGMLNDLIGQQSDATPRGAPDPEPRAADDATQDRSARLAEFVERRRRETGIEPLSPDARTRVGELRRDNIKILANERTNALIIMASQSDLATLKEIIRDMDIMLSQVLIETVILEVSLEDRLETGVDWVQRAMVAYDRQGAASAAFATRGGGGSLRAIDPLRRTTTDSFGDASSGITHYLTYFGLNLDVVLRATKSDSRARILSSPVILTQDNKEATIEATTRRYFLKGTRYERIGTTTESIPVDDVEQRDVGITLKVTPRINAHGFVVMNVEQTVENIAGTQTINEREWPIVTSRRLGADIAVSSGETVVLGGLVMNNRIQSRTGIPILRAIPLLGMLFRADRTEDSRSEVVVFLTPYVLDSPEALAAEARRRKDAISAGDMWEAGWSASHLASPPRKTRTPATRPSQSAPEAAPDAPQATAPQSVAIDPPATAVTDDPVPVDAPPEPEIVPDIEAAIRGAFTN